MCWFIDVRVIATKPSIAGRIVVPKLPAPATLLGRLPELSLQDSHCACDLVKGDHVVGLREAVDGFCAQDAVKRVEVLKFWAAQKPDAPPETAVTQAEFAELCARAGFEANVRYRISPDRLHKP